MTVKTGSPPAQPLQTSTALSLLALRDHQRNQFLVEAMMLCADGGVIGILIGIAAGFALTAVIGLPYVLSPYLTLIAFAVSSTVGILFDYYPAARASKLDPITALWTE